MKEFYLFPEARKVPKKYVPCLITQAVLTPRISVARQVYGSDFSSLTLALDENGTRKEISFIREEEIRNIVKLCEITTLEEVSTTRLQRHGQIMYFGEIAIGIKI